MALIVNNQIVTDATILKSSEPKRTRYQLIRKPKTQSDYDKMKVMVDGEEKSVSNASKYFLDMLLE